MTEDSVSPIPQTEVVSVVVPSVVVKSDSTHCQTAASLESVFPHFSDPEQYFQDAVGTALSNARAGKPQPSDVGGTTRWFFYVLKELCALTGCQGATLYRVVDDFADATNESSPSRFYQHLSMFSDINADSAPAFTEALNQTSHKSADENSVIGCIALLVKNRPSQFSDIPILFFGERYGVSFLHTNDIHERRLGNIRAMEEKNFPIRGLFFFIIFKDEKPHLIFHLLRLKDCPTGEIFSPTDISRAFFVGRQFESLFLEFLEMREAECVGEPRITPVLSGTPTGGLGEPPAGAASMVASSVEPHVNSWLAWMLAAEALLAVAGSRADFVSTIGKFFTLRNPEQEMAEIAKIVIGLRNFAQPVIENPDDVFKYEEFVKELDRDFVLRPPQ